MLWLPVLRDTSHRDAQCLGYAFAVGWIGLHAADDMADLDLLGRVTHCAGCALEENLLLLGRCQAKEKPGLRVVVVVLAMVPLIRRRLRC